MKKFLKELLFQLLVGVIFLVLGYGLCAFLGWFMSLDIPIPVLIIGFCILFYVVLRKEIEENG